MVYMVYGKLYGIYSIHIWFIWYTIYIHQFMVYVPRLNDGLAILKDAPKDVEIAHLRRPNGHSWAVYIGPRLNSDSTSINII